MRHNPVTGALYFLRGFGLIMRPGIRPFVIVPLLVNVVLFAIAIWFAWDQVGALVETWLPEWEWLRYIIYPIFFLVIAIIVFFGFSLVANLIAAPFNGLLAEAVERHLTGRVPDAEGGWKRMMKEFWQSIGSELNKIGYVLARQVPLLLLFLVPVVNVAAPFLWITFSAWMIAVSYVDYPMGNHGLTFPEQRRRLRQRRFLGLGFGAATLVALTIPLVNFLVMPSAVAGATAMWVDRLAELDAEPAGTTRAGGASA